MEREMEGGKRKIAERIWNLRLSFSALSPLTPCTQLSLLLFQLIFVHSYKSWCLLLKELLRVVTMLELSSASSSSFTSRTSLKNLKMESKLTQEVSSCLSVPACERQTKERLQNICSYYLKSSFASHKTTVATQKVKINEHH